MKLYYHKTDGGAEYLCSSHIKGTKEGAFPSEFIVRIDGNIKKDAEILIQKSNDTKLVRETIKFLEATRKEAVSECLRANKGTLKQANVTTIKDMENQLDRVETYDDWDDVQWHSGYVSGLNYALEILTGL